MNPTAAIADLIGASPLDFTGHTAPSNTFTDECEECTATGLIRIEIGHTHRAGGWTDTSTWCLAHAADAIWAADMTAPASIDVTIADLALTLPLAA
ncbi:hypothetical protein [Nocardia rhizosphaerae]|uniref:Uncharacterized protein n=1 Tax=Nocardia rhizosphaerae TaxID=1691571 RepID=A0ABV8LED3_9NOCA